MTRVIVSCMAAAAALICFQDVVITKIINAAAAAYFRYSLGFITAATRIQQAKIAQYAMKATTINVDANPNNHIDTNVTYFIGPLLPFVAKA